MNPIIKDIAKIELHKLLYVGFIYPILDSEWVSPLVVFPKKNGEWRICVDYMDSRKYHFPFPFIDQASDTLSQKKYFSSLDGFSGYNQVQIHPTDRDKTTFTYPRRTVSYMVFPFGLCNAPSTFQGVVLSIFLDFVHDKMEICMDDFTPYKDTFKQSFLNLDKVLQRCIEMNLCLSNEKFLMLCDQGILLGHRISNKGIEFEPAKVSVIVNLPKPHKQRNVIFFGVMLDTIEGLSRTLGKFPHLCLLC